jgi:prepilin-type N-terminal cleavage/methylation domain-containing protein
VLKGYCMNPIIIKKAKGFTLVELMVVIVIVGILAAVAIPKFLEASNKAKASEFPTQLTSIYTGEIAYNAENASYCTDFGVLRSSGGVDINSSSMWFTYTVAAGAGGISSTFVGTATVRQAFGTTNTSDAATIDNSNNKACSPNLQKYVPTWQ